jgi:hypothetical protein
MRNQFMPSLRAPHSKPRGTGNLKRAFALQEGDAPDSLCACDELSACFPTADTPRPLTMLYSGVETPVLSGNTTPGVARNVDQLSTVLFTELYTYIGRSDLRLHFRHLQLGAFTVINVTSNAFKISAGRLQELRVIQSPNMVSSCTWSYNDGFQKTTVMSNVSALCYHIYLYKLS